MYRRPILCTLYGAVDFLNVLKKGCWWGGGECYWYIVKYYVPVDDGWEEVLVHNIPVLHYVPITPHPLNTFSHNTAARRPPHPSYTQQHTTTLHNSTRVHKTTNVPVVFMAWYKMILRGATSLLGALEGVGAIKTTGTLIVNMPS
jgi:hypothetical protein